MSGYRSRSCLDRVITGVWWVRFRCSLNGFRVSSVVFGAVNTTVNALSCLLCGCVSRTGR